MEVLERENSQSRRSSIKRPWEEDTTLPEKDNAWHSALLPPIDTVPYRKVSIQRGGDEGAKWNGQDSREPVIKKAKFEGNEYNTFPRQNLMPNGKIPPSRNPNLMYTQNRGSLESPTFTSKSQGPNGGPNRGGPADSHDLSNLCRRCKRLTIQERESTTVGSPDSCEDCKRSPELAWVTFESANMLTQLAETLSSGISSDERGIVRGRDQNRPGTTGCPPIAEFGLKQTLNWLLGRIYHVNQLADQLVRQVPAGSLQNHSKDNYRNGTKAQDGPADIMKRRIDVDSDDPFKSKDDADSSSDSRPHTRRRSVTTSMLANEDLPPLRSQPDYHPPLPSLDGGVQRASGMNPPPAPNRQLPSPPGRSFPSPTSLSFPSPSTPSYGINSQGVNLPLPSSLHQQTNNNYLPPITAAPSSDSALRDHTAALQHEVSVQKIALSSLQGEHDKLLAAFSRSQTRASALEKKHAVSDSEIISLTEEKLRLQAQVIELERDVEELARSRDESRQAAVQEGSQYVEIVKKASRLEEMAGEERKSWKKEKEDMERKIEALKARSRETHGGVDPAEDSGSSSRHGEDMETDTPASSEKVVPLLKMELTNEPQQAVSISHPSGPPEREESVEDLRVEIRRLRERCAEVEGALRAFRDNSRSMEDIIKTLLERADSTLRSQQ